MKKYKSKVIGAILILVTLGGAWVLGGVPDINSPETFTQTIVSDPISYEEYEVEYDNEIIISPYEEEIEAIEAIEEVEILEEEVVSEDHVEEYVEISTEAYVESYVQISGEYHPQMREPVEPEDMAIGDESFTITLEIRADTLLFNMHLLHRDKHELVPYDGVIFPRTEVTAYAGESVFNVLQREMRRNGIHMASRFTPIFNSAYVEAINNLYEFDGGALSGWMYKVNGWFPNFGSSRYLLSPGDEIVWLYTVDLGRDLGVTWDYGGQEDE